MALHLGVEEDFRPGPQGPSRRSWSDDLAALEAALRAAGVAVRPNADRAPGAGAYVDDPFGNRIELIAEGEDRVSAGRRLERGRRRQGRGGPPPPATTGGRVGGLRATGGA